MSKVSLHSVWICVLTNICLQRLKAYKDASIPAKEVASWTSFSCMPPLVIRSAIPFKKPERLRGFVDAQAMREWEAEQAKEGKEMA
jgi:hypothetical protein